LNQHRLRSDFTVKFIVFTHRFVCDFVWRACLRVRPLTTSLWCRRNERRRSKASI
jgi:hypothetical protein